MVIAFNRQLIVQADRQDRLLDVVMEHIASAAIIAARARITEE
jgi:hypothetical protein